MESKIVKNESIECNCTRNCHCDFQYYAPYSWRKLSCNNPTEHRTNGKCFMA
jgi:hypothetical protein